MSNQTSAPHPIWYWLTGRTELQAHAGAMERAKPFWNPYAAGVLLGVTLFLSFFIMGRGLGASGPLNRLTAAVYDGFGLARMLDYYAPYFRFDASLLVDYSLFSILGVFIGGYASAAVARRAHLTVEKGPRIGYNGRFMLAFGGGFLMALGARLARGCTSGQVLTGSSMLAVGSLVMFVMFFAGGFAAAYFVRRQWI